MSTATASPNETTLPKPEGLEGVVAASTALSHVFGEEGRLVYRGYDIHELAGKASFEEVAHLLWIGHLPTRAELAAFQSKLEANRALPEAVIDVLRLLPADAAPMDALRTGLSALGAIDSEHFDETPTSMRRSRSRRASRASWPPSSACAAASSRSSRRSGHNTAQSYLYQLFGKEPEERHWKPLDTYLVLLADHGMNASTFTARVIASTQSDLISALTGAVGALKGPLHGGAPSKVLDMLHAIGDADNVEKWLTNALDNGDRLMGFGHRVYKAEDPRAEILRDMAETASDPDFFKLSKLTEDRAPRHCSTSASRAGGSTRTSSSTRRRCWRRSVCRATCSRRHSRSLARLAGARTCWSRSATTG